MSDIGGPTCSAARSGAGKRQAAPRAFAAGRPAAEWIRLHHRPARRHRTRGECCLAAATARRRQPSGRAVAERRHPQREIRAANPGAVDRGDRTRSGVLLHDTGIDAGDFRLAPPRFALAEPVVWPHPRRARRAPRLRSSRRATSGHHATCSENAGNPLTHALQRMRQPR